MRLPSQHSWPRRFGAVLGGGFLGTIARYWLSLLIQAHLGKGWPFDILFINVSGAFVLAFITTLADASLLIGPTRRLFINIGFLGAFTTFSSLALGDVNLIGSGKLLLALLYVVCSLLGGIVFVLLGDQAGSWGVRWLSQTRRFRDKKRPQHEGEFVGGKEAQGHIDIQDDLLAK